MTRDKQGTRAQFWREHLRACAVSGLTLKAYAAQHGLNVHSLYAARRRSKAAGPDDGERIGPAPFVRVETGPRSGTLCRIQLANGTRVELNIELSVLPEVLRCAGALR